MTLCDPLHDESVTLSEETSGVVIYIMAFTTQLLTVFEENLDVVLLQEALSPDDFEWWVADYTLHSLHVTDGTRGYAAFVRSGIPHSRLARPSRLRGRRGGHVVGAARGRPSAAGV